MLSNLYYRMKLLATFYPFRSKINLVDTISLRQFITPPFTFPLSEWSTFYRVGNPWSVNEKQF